MDSGRGELGIALLSAPQSKLGTWQLKRDESRDWEDITSLQESILLPESLQLEYTHRGYVPITNFIVQMVCEEVDMEEEISYTHRGDVDFWNEVLEEEIYFKHLKERPQLTFS